MSCRDLEHRLEALLAGSLSAHEARRCAEHLASCAPCRELLELAGIAEVRPDPGFVADVLVRTLPFEVQIRRWWDALWPQLWRRPRFASEAAYVGLVVLVLVFVTPGSPLAAVPAEALAMAQDPPLPRLELPPVAIEGGRWGRWGAELHTTADDAKDLVIEVRTRMGTFWGEAASLLETGLETTPPTTSTTPNTPNPLKEKS